MFKHHFIFQCVIFSLLFCVCLTFTTLLAVSLGKPAAEPQYREYTLLSSERKGKSGRYRLFSLECIVYAEETDKPLVIDSVVYPYAEVDALELIPSGETITVGIESENSSHYEIASLRYGDKTILSFKDYLTAHRRNKVIGIVALSIFSLIFFSLNVWGVICYAKTGYTVMFKKGEQTTEEILKETEKE